MSDLLVHYSLIGIGLYLLCGVGAATYLLARKIRVLDPSATHASWGFHLFILPGLVALWPCLIFKSHLIAATSGPTPSALRRSQGWAFHVLLVVLPTVMVLALLWRPAATAALSSAPLPGLPARPWSEAILLTTPQPKHLPLQLELRRDAQRRFQIGLLVPKVLDDPLIALYWSPTSSEELPSDAVFLGSVWGPSQLYYALPTTTVGVSSGTLYFLKLGEDQTLIETLTLP